MNRPDFIADPNGKIRDVRHEKGSQPIESLIPPSSLSNSWPGYADEPMTLGQAAFFVVVMTASVAAIGIIWAFVF